MTEQYAQKNINIPGAPRQIVFAIALSTSNLTTDDGNVSVDATLFSGTLQLPLASEFPGQELTVQKIDATGNAVSIIPLSGSGDSILGAAGAATLGAQFSTTTFKSDGVSGWTVSANIP